MANLVRSSVVVCGLLIAACGDDETSSSGSGGGSSSSDASSAATGSGNGTTTSTGVTGTGVSSGSTSGPGGGDVGGGGTGGSGGGDSGGGDSGGGGSGGGDPCCYPYDSGEPADTTPATLPIAESGTRLRARWIDGGGNARAFKGFHDLDLDLDCTFERAIDGAMRCLPMRRGSASNFADDTCDPDSRVHVQFTCDDDYEFISTFETLEDPEGCSERYGFGIHAVERDAPIATDTVYYLGNEGQCVPLRIAGASVFPIEPIDTVIYAEATAVVEPGDDRLSQGFLETADGARMATAPIDDTYGTCIWSGYDGDARCVPLIPPSHEQVAYSDATCETFDPDLFVDLSDGACEAPAVYRYDAATCGVDYFTSVVATADYVLDGESCVEGEPQGAVAFGEALGLGDFAPIDALGVGTGRLQLYTFAQGNQAFAQTYLEHFWDTEIEATCEPIQFDGELRCVPTDRGLVAGNAFADAACTNRLVGGALIDCPPPKFATLPVEDACIYLDPAEIYRVGAAFEGAVGYYVDERGDCVELEIPDGVRVFETTPVPIGDFAILEIDVD